MLFKELSNFSKRFRVVKLQFESSDASKRDLTSILIKCETQDVKGAKEV